jgi:mono/diheme cytochrome c family protein
MEGERRTMSLAGGVAGRGWLHASGTHIDAHEFADIIVKERLGGALSPADTDALAEYVARAIPKLQSPKVDAALVTQGKSIFANKCAGCHSGDKMTSGNPDSANEWLGGLAAGPMLYDVGTVSDDSHVILGTFFESILPPLEGKLFHELRGDRDLGPDDFVQQTLDFRPRPVRKASEFKAPSLVNVWNNVVFFHDGRFDKLDDVVGYLNKQLTLNMTADDQKAVIEYLRTL